jgi:hypothetical protein
MVEAAVAAAVAEGVVEAGKLCVLYRAVSALFSKRGTYLQCFTTAETFYY